MPNQRARPNLRRRRLGASLKDCRNEAGLTLEAAAARMGWEDHTRLSKLENARAHITAADLAKLLSIYGITDQAYIAALTGLAKDAGRSGWWATYGDTIASTYADYISVESDATDIRMWSPTLVPGLLQTAAYAHEVISATTNYGPETVHARVDVRLARQSVLSRTDKPLKFWAVIGEPVLHQEFPSNPDAMRDQLRHLMYLADRPTITIQIMPTSVASHPGLTGLFSVVAFPTPWPALVQLESLKGGQFVEDAQDVAEFDSAFQRIVAAALPVDTSREFIKNVLEERHL